MSFFSYASIISYIMVVMTFHDNHPFLRNFIFTKLDLYSKFKLFLPISIVFSKKSLKIIWY
jgi:hypothetical protein